jgi:hypothetical protein
MIVEAPCVWADPPPPSEDIVKLSLPFEMLSQIQRYALELRAATEKDVDAYRTEWAAEGHQVLPEDGYPLKVGALREASDNLLHALEVASLCTPPGPFPADDELPF